MIKIQGADIDKKFSYIETVLNRMSRRLVKNVVVMSPTSVISNFTKEIPEDGILLRMMFPCSGKIKGVTTSFDAVKDSKIVFKVTLGNSEHINPQEELKVNTGDKMIIKAEGVGSNIYLSVMFIADNILADKETLAISSLLKDEE
jgi:hypothetical protein